MIIEGAEIEALKNMDEVLKGRPKSTKAAYHIVNGKENTNNITSFSLPEGKVKFNEFR
jgi:hypothetical protein